MASDGGQFLQLRHSPEMTRVCSPELTRRPGWAGDDNALPTYGLRAKVRRMGWATLTERKWIISGERRGSPAMAMHFARISPQDVYA